MSFPKKVPAANRKHNQDESHPSSENPGLKRNKGSIRTVPGGSEELSGTKGPDLCEAAHSIYQRAVAAAPDSEFSDQGLRER